MLKQLILQREFAIYLGLSRRLSHQPKDPFCSLYLWPQLSRLLPFQGMLEVGKAESRS